ncbi:MAG: hypothetical protein ACJ763_16570 [Bdellovibrionia bacterium]
MLLLPGQKAFGTVLQLAQGDGAGLDSSVAIVDSAGKDGEEVYRMDEGELIEGAKEDPKHPGWYSLQGKDRNGKPHTFWFKKSKNLNSVDPGKVQIGLDVEGAVTLTRKPGLSWSTAKASDKVGWPVAQDKLKYLDSELVEMEDPITHEIRWQLFYKVKFTHKSKKSAADVTEGEGWVNADYIRNDIVRNDEEDQLGQLIKKLDKKDDPKCAPDRKHTAPHAKAVVEAKEALQPLAEEEIVERISPHLGKCLLDDSLNVPELGKGTSAFDSTVLKHWKEASTPKDIPSPLSGKLTKSDLVNIDTFARTIYGEMASCFDNGLQYPMAMAKVVSNRVEYIQKHEGEATPFAPESIRDKLKGSFSAVLTHPYQFSVWNKKIDGKTNPSLKQVLCPPRDPEAKFWPKVKPSKKESGIWKESIRIAIEAVLFPEKFRKKTEHVNELYYTSGLGYFMQGFQRAYHAVMGKPVSRGRCIELWRKK